MSDSGSLLARFVRGTLSTGLGSLSTMVLGLLATMVAARRLAPEAFGGFVLLQVVAVFLTRVSSFGLDLSVARSVASTDDGERKRQLINTAVYFRLSTVFVVSLVALIARPALYAAFGSSLMPNLLLFLPILFLLESSTGLLKSALQGLFLFKRMGMTDFIAGLFNFLLVLVFVQFFDRGAMGLIQARVISLSLSCAYAYLATPVKKRLEFHPQALKEMLVFGFPLQINDILGFAFQRIDTLIIGVLLGPADVAYYEIARRIPDSLARLYEAFRSVYYAFLSRLFGLGQQNKAAQLLNNSTRLVSFASILGALLALLFGRDIIILLFSEYYLASVPAFVLLMAALGISLVGNILGTSLVAVGDSDKPAIINVVHTAVSSLANLVLIPVLGIAGAALATLSGTCATNPLNVMFLRRRKVDVTVRAYLKPIVILGAFGILVLVVKPTGLLQKGSVIALFILACVFLSVVTSEDLVAVCGEARLTVFELIRHLPSRSTRV